MYRTPSYDQLGRTSLVPCFSVMALMMVNLALMNTAVCADEFQVQKRTVIEDSSAKLAHRPSTSENWKAEQTAVILCDVWDYHHSINAVRRLDEMLPRMNEFLKEARRRGATIIHSPSDCMPNYEKHAARLRAINTPKTNLPKDIASWCSRIPSEQSKTNGIYPVDQSDGGEDDDPEEHRQWAAKLTSLGRNPGMPWKAQSPGIEIEGSSDYISDRGDEVWSILRDRKIEHVILLGVHTNMCVLGRPFGLRQMAAQKMDVVLVRDLTDCMYNPKRWPYVDHFTGNDLVVSYVERFICPTITSNQILSGQPLQFQGDKRATRDVISIAEPKPNDWRLLSLEKNLKLGSLGPMQTASIRCSIRFPAGSLEQPATLSVQEQVTGVWLNGKSLDVRPSQGGEKEYLIPKALTFGNDDANCLVLQVDISKASNDWITAPKLKDKSTTLLLNSNWEVKLGADESSRSIPLPAKFGMSPDVFYTLP